MVQLGEDSSVTAMCKGNKEFSLTFLVADADFAETAARRSVGCRQG